MGKYAVVTSTATAALCGFKAGDVVEVTPNSRLGQYAHKLVPVTGGSAGRIYGFANDENIQYIRSDKQIKITETFAVGQFVKGNSKADEEFELTTSEMTLGEITTVTDDFFYVKIKEHRYMSFKGRECAIAHKYANMFDLTEPPAVEADDVATEEITTYEGVLTAVKGLDERITKLENGEPVESEEPVPVEPEFKEGDKVRAVKTSFFSYDVKVGETYTVEQTDYRDNTLLLRENGSWIHMKDVELVTQPHFKVGDRVKLLSGGGRYPLLGYVDGEEYVVDTPKYSHSLGDRVLINPEGRGGRGAAKPEQLELVSTVSAPEWLNVGDVVRVDEDGDSYIGKILKNDYSGLPYKVENVLTGEYEWQRKSHVTLIK